MNIGLEPRAAGTRASATSRGAHWFARVWHSIARALTREWTEAGTHRLHFAVVTVALLLGAWLRSYRFWSDPIALWLDEATWAVDLLTDPVAKQGIRPLGFVLTTRWLATLIGPYEQVVRLLPYLAGLASIPLSYWCARLLFRNQAVQLATPFVFALHPLLIDFSREFKPYSVEVTCHLIVIATTLGALRSNKPSTRQLVLAVGAPIVLLPFAYNLIFVFPFVFGVLSWDGWREQRRGQLLATLGAAGVSLALLLGLYFGIWQHIHSQLYGAPYWGNKYDVFVVADRHTRMGPQPAAHVEWLVQKYTALFSGPGFYPDDWRVVTKRIPFATELAGVYRVLWPIASITAGVLLWKNRRRTLLLLVSPLLVLGLFNLAGKWPMGFFRVNLFTLTYTTFLGLCGVDALLGKVNSSFAFRLGTALTFLVLLVPRLTFSAPLPAIKQSRPWMAHSEFRRVLDALEQADPRQGTVLYSDTYSYRTFPYYGRWHPDYRRDSIIKRLKVEQHSPPRRLHSALKRIKRGTRWVLVSRQGFVAETRKILKKLCAQLEEYDVGDHHVLAQCTRAVPKRTRSAKTVAPSRKANQRRKQRSRSRRSKHREKSQSAHTAKTEHPKRRRSSR